jgi:hypothetical protein
VRFPGDGPEDGHAVGDRLHTGECRRPARVRVQDQVQPDRSRQPFDRPRRLKGVEGSHLEPDDPDHDQAKDRCDERVDGGDEDMTGHPDAAEVHPSDHPDEPDRGHDPVRIRRRERRVDGGNARRHAHGRRQHVVEEKPGSGDLWDRRGEIVPRHDVRAAGARVRLDRLPVGEDQRRQQRDDDRGEREHEGEGSDPRDGDQDPDHRLGRIRTDPKASPESTASPAGLPRCSRRSPDVGSACPSRVRRTG